MVTTLNSSETRVSRRVTYFWSRRDWVGTSRFGRGRWFRGGGSSPGPVDCGRTRSVLHGWWVGRGSLCPRGKPSEVLRPHGNRHKLLSVSRYDWRDCYVPCVLLCPGKGHRRTTGETRHRVRTHRGRRKRSRWSRRDSGSRSVYGGVKVPMSGPPLFRTWGRSPDVSLDSTRFLITLEQ